MSGKNFPYMNAFREGRLHATPESAELVRLKRIIEDQASIIEKLKNNPHQIFNREMASAFKLMYEGMKKEIIKQERARIRNQDNI